MNKDNIKSPCPYCEKVYDWNRGLRKHLTKYHVEKQALNMSARAKKEDKA